MVAFRTGEYSTIGGLLCSIAGKIPTAGDKIYFAEHMFTILKVEDTRRVVDVLAERSTAAAPLASQRESGRRIGEENDSGMEYENDLEYEVDSRDSAGSVASSTFEDDGYDYIDDNDVDITSKNVLLNSELLRSVMAQSVNGTFTGSALSAAVGDSELLDSDLLYETFVDEDGDEEYTENGLQSSGEGRDEDNRNKITEEQEEEEGLSFVDGEWVSSNTTEEGGSGGHGDIFSRG